MHLYNDVILNYHLKNKIMFYLFFTLRLTFTVAFLAQARYRFLGSPTQLSLPFLGRDAAERLDL